MKYLKLYEEARPVHKRVERREDGSLLREVWEDKYGILNREDGPSWIEYYENGNVAWKEWFKEDAPHREDGPAKIEYAGDGSPRRESWFYQGELHRLDGPAVTLYMPDGEIRQQTWYYEGEKIDAQSQKQFEERINLSSEEREALAYLRSVGLI